MNKKKCFIACLLCLFLLSGCGDVAGIIVQDSTDNHVASKTNSPLTLEEAKVVRVVDGDTIVARLESGAEEKVRFIGVNTPESTTRHEPYGEEASEFTISRLDGKTIYLEKDVSERDRYGRLLRYIWLEPPTEVSKESIRANLFNAILLIEGYAHVATYPPDVKYTDDYFIDLQAEARNAEKGLWGLKDDTKQVQSENKQDIVYITKSGKKYHKEGCIYLGGNKTAISIEEAQSQGYEPCSVCRP